MFKKSPEMEEEATVIHSFCPAVETSRLLSRDWCLMTCEMGGYESLAIFSVSLSSGEYDVAHAYAARRIV